MNKHVIEYAIPTLFLVALGVINWISINKLIGLIAASMFVVFYAGSYLLSSDKSFTSISGLFILPTKLGFSLISIVSTFMFFGSMHLEDIKKSEFNASGGNELHESLNPIQTRINQITDANGNIKANYTSIDENYLSDKFKYEAELSKHRNKNIRYKETPINSTLGEYTKDCTHKKWKQKQVIKRYSYSCGKIHKLKADIAALDNQYNNQRQAQSELLKLQEESKEITKKHKQEQKNNSPDLVSIDEVTHSAMISISHYIFGAKVGEEDKHLLMPAALFLFAFGFSLIMDLGLFATRFKGAFGTDEKKERDAEKPDLTPILDRNETDTKQNSEQEQENKDVSKLVSVARTVSDTTRAVMTEAERINAKRKITAATFRDVKRLLVLSESESNLDAESALIKCLIENLRNYSSECKLKYKDIQKPNKRGYGRASASAVKNILEENNLIHKPDGEKSYKWIDEDNLIDLVINRNKIVKLKVA